MGLRDGVIVEMGQEVDPILVALWVIKTPQEGLALMGQGDLALVTSDLDTIIEMDQEVESPEVGCPATIRAQVQDHITTVLVLDPIVDQDQGQDMEMDQDLEPESSEGDLVASEAGEVDGSETTISVHGLHITMTDP